eukprot:250582_1
MAEADQKETQKIENKVRIPFHETYGALFARICGEADNYGHMISIESLARFPDHINPVIKGCVYCGRKNELWYSFVQENGKASQDLECVSCVVDRIWKKEKESINKQLSQTNNPKIQEKLMWYLNTEKEFKTKHHKDHTKNIEIVDLPIHLPQ